MTTYVVQTSGGIGSWAAGKRAVATYGRDAVDFVFADTQIEDVGAYRLLLEGTANAVGVALDPAILTAVDALPEPYVDLAQRKAGLLAIRAAAAEALPCLTWIADGRTPWEVFRDVRLLGNSRMDPCSRLLKRLPLARWMAEAYPAGGVTAVIGIDWQERPRFDDIVKRQAAQGGIPYVAPMCDRPYLLKDDMIAWAASEGIAIPALYAEGASHNNCGGGCVKMGQGNAANLLRNRPETYRYWETEEERMRTMLDKDVSMLSDRSGGAGKKPFTLRALRERIEAGGQIDLFDIGGCGCALPAMGEEAA